MGRGAQLACRPMTGPCERRSVTIPRLVAIGFIFFCACVAWSTLGASVVSRTGESDQRLAKEVAQLWGGRHEQAAPAAVVVRPRVVTEQVQEKDARGQTGHARGVQDRDRPRAHPPGLEPAEGGPRPRPAPQGAALVRDLRRRLRGNVPPAQPRRRSRARWTSTSASRPRKRCTTASPSVSMAGRWPARATSRKGST